jgi:hypothetical protein
VASKFPFEFSNFADVGTSEPFLARIALGLAEILDTTYYDKRNEIKAGIIETMNSLLSAFLSLRQLRGIADDRSAPLMTKVKHFDDMCGSLWTAYKDRMQNVTRLMGYNIGFLFEEDKKFEKGCASFPIEHPQVDGALIQRMKQHRATWQSDLERFRNQYIEHRKLKQEEVASFYSLARAEALFQSVWVGIEETLIILMAAGLPPAFCVHEIPQANRNPHAPKRFGISLRGPLKRVNPDGTEWKEGT